MSDFETPPKEVHIYPDYGSVYAWDEEGTAICLAPAWPDISELSEIEEELVAWADTYDREMTSTQDDYDWAAHSRRGRIIAVKLAKVLRPKGIPVVFESDTRPLTGDEVLTPEPLLAARPGEPAIPLPPRTHRVERWMPDESSSVPDKWLFATRHDLPAYAFKSRIVRLISQAIDSESEIVITYQGGTAPGGQRRIVPKRLFTVEGYTAAYLLALDCYRTEERTFRLDRITQCGTDLASLDRSIYAISNGLRAIEVLPKDSPFVLTVGEANVGWCGFEVKFGDRIWRCEASYIGEYPLLPLINTAVQLPQFFLENRCELDDSEMDIYWDCLAADEPGGIVLRVIPLIQGSVQRVRVQVFRYRNDELWPSPDKCPDVPPEAEGIITQSAFARAVYTAAVDALMSQGISRLSVAWEPSLLSDGRNTVVFPLDRFLYLHRHVHGLDRCETDTQGTMTEDIAILQEILREFQIQK